MDIAKIVKRPWMDREAREALSFRVGEALVGVRDPITTTALLIKLGVPMDDKWAVKNCLDHLYHARKDGLLAGVFTAGPPLRGMGGKPSYKWHDVKA